MHSFYSLHLSDCHTHSQMDRGSLEDVLQYNASAVLDADSMMAILRDVVSGMK